MEPFPKDGESAAAAEPSRGAAPSSGVVVQVREKKGPLRAAIPYMPFPVAVICLFLNTFVPGLGKELHKPWARREGGRRRAAGTGGSKARGCGASVCRRRGVLPTPAATLPGPAPISVGSRSPSRRQLSPTAPEEGRRERGRERAYRCAPAESFAAGAGSGRRLRGLERLLGSGPAESHLPAVARPSGQRPRSAEGMRAPPQPSRPLGWHVSRGR